jgi:Protein of unknown function (DUF3106)
MRVRNIIMVWLAAVTLAAVMSSPCFAQRDYYRPVQGRQVARPQPQGHAGDWLRHYQGLSPAERERALQNDPGFRRLSPDKQQMLRQRLEHFYNLPPQQQQRVLNRMETWEHLTPEQKDQARQLYSQFRQLPPNRQGMVSAAVKNLRSMPPEQRDQIINSDRFKSNFNEQELGVIRGATHLPLAPAEGAEGAEPQE